MNELPSVALTERFLRFCQDYGSQHLVVKLVAAGRDTCVAGLPASDDWTTWDAHEMRAAVDVTGGNRRADRATVPDLQGFRRRVVGRCTLTLECWRSKRVFRPRTELARPDDIQLSATQAYGVIAQAEYEKKIGRKVTKILRHLDQRRRVEVDDFVISMRSFQGGLERAWRSGCIRSSYIVLQAATTELSVGYFGHLFKSAGYIAALQSTANQVRAVLEHEAKVLRTALAR